MNSTEEDIVTRYEGGCLCGAVRYHSSGPPLRCVICHCEFCRKHSGAPCLVFVHFPVDAFRWDKGTPARFRSSKYAERGYCRECGSTLSMHEEVLSDRVQVTLGSLDDPTAIRPQDHVWTKSQVDWFEVSDGLPRFEQNSSAVPSKALQD